MTDGTPDYCCSGYDPAFGKSHRRLFGPWLSCRPLASLVVLLAVVVAWRLPRVLERKGRYATRQHAWIIVYVTGLLYSAMNAWYIMVNGIFHVAIVLYFLMALTSILLLLFAGAAADYYSFLAGLDPTEDERLLSFSGSMPSSALSRAPGDHDHLTAFDDENFDLDGRPIARYTISAA
jgi:hypothetical protein